MTVPFKIKATTTDFEILKPKEKLEYVLKYGGHSDLNILGVRKLYTELYAHILLNSTKNHSHSNQFLIMTYALYSKLRKRAQQSSIVRQFVVLGFSPTNNNIYARKKAVQHEVRPIFDFQTYLYKVHTN